MRDVIRANCSSCHGIDEYGYYAMSRANWSALIDRMKLTPSGLVPGAVISDEDKEILLDWLVAEFGPGAEPFERRYVVREITAETRLSDDDAHALIERACTGCHDSADIVLGSDLDEEGWRSTLTSKIATGTQILIDEVDPLIDWIMRRN